MGKAFPQAAGPDVSSGQGADWDTMRSEEQVNAFSPNTVPMLVRLHDISGFSREEDALVELWVSGYSYGTPSCIRYCPITDRVR